MIRRIFLAFLFTFAAVPALAAPEPGQRTRREIEKLSLEQIREAVQENASVLQIYHEVLRRRFPDEVGELSGGDLDLKDADLSKLERLSVDQIMEATKVVNAENDVLIARGEMLLAGASAAPRLQPAARATMIPAGTYGCMGMMGSTLMAMGTIEIRDQTFRYAPPGGKLGSFQPYEISAAGKITWHGPMGALNEAPAKIKESFVEEKPSYRSIIVKHQPTGKDFTMLMGCRNDTKPGH